MRTPWPAAARLPCRLLHSSAAPRAARPRGFRKSFDHSQATAINWFPGHMAVATKKLNEVLRHVDLVIEVRDARIPFSSAPSTATMSTARRKLVVLNKCDLACPTVSAEVLGNLAAAGQEAIHIDSRDIHDVRRLLQLVQGRATAELGTKEFKTIPYKMAVVGVPNTGKSTLLNALKRQALGKGGKARTGGTPGITRHVGYSEISRSPGVFLLDSPGVMPPGNLETDLGLKIALTGGVADHLLDMELMADYLLFHLNQHQCFDYVERYASGGLSAPSDDLSRVLRAVGKSRGSQGRQQRSGRGGGGESVAGERRAGAAMVHDFRQGKLGRIVLDVPDGSDMAAVRTLLAAAVDEPTLIAFAKAKGNRASWLSFLERSGLGEVGHDPKRHELETLRRFWAQSTEATTPS